jgi:hypothetical protein
MNLRHSATNIINSILLRDSSDNIKKFKRDHLYSYYLLMIAYIYLIVHTYQTVIIPAIKSGENRCKITGDPINRRKLYTVIGILFASIIAEFMGFAPYYSRMFIIIGIFMHIIMAIYIYYSIIC